MKLDWQKIILNLRRAGFPVEAQARRVGMDPDTLRHYARGECREPRFSQGLALLDLHLSVCPDQHDLSALRLVADRGPGDRTDRTAGRR